MTAPGRRVRLVGLTGGIATGKSTAARLFAAEGAHVIDADELARRVVRPGSEGLAEIRQAFGPGVLLPDGSLDRAALGALVFRDPEARARLNAIVHPRVEEAFRSELARARGRDPDALVIYDVPLLFEGDKARAFDLTVVVYVPRSVQLARLLARDGLPVEDAEARLASQLDIEEKAARADVVLDNRGTLDELASAVRRLLARWREPPAGDSG